MPLLSLKTLSDNLDAAIKALADIEPAANTCEAAAQAAENASDAAKAGRAQLAAGTTYLQNQVEDRKKSIGNLVGNLLAAQASCNTAANVLKPLLEGLAREVQGAFGVDPHALINGLSTMAFSLEGNPATAVQAGSQVSSVVLDGLSTVTDNDGNPAPKGSILGPVRSLEGDLKTDLIGLKGDFTDVSESDKLNVSASKPYSFLVSLDKVQQLCDKFTGSRFQCRRRFEQAERLYCDDHP